MPWTKNRKTSTRKPSKPMVRRVKKVMYAQKKRAFKKGTDTFSLMCTSSAIVVPTQGIATANYVNLWVPLMDATAKTSFAQNADFSVYRYLYDRVRINSVLVKVTPKANVFDQANAQNDGTLNVTGDGLMHTAIDRDGPVPLSGSTALDTIKRYGSHKSFSVMKPFFRKYSIKYPTGVWFDSSNIFEDETLIHRLGGTGGIQFYAENLVEDNSEVYNEPWASVEITYHCVFSGRKPSTVSISPSGVLSLTELEVGAPLAPSVLSRIQGTIANTDYTDGSH